MEVAMKGEYIITNKVWNGINIEIIYQKNYVQYDDGQKMAYLEVRSQNKMPLPIAPNGFKSRFLEAKEVDQYNSIWDYVFNWFNKEAQNKFFKTNPQYSQQLSLF